jgi:hypothetical protein
MIYVRYLLLTHLFAVSLAAQHANAGSVIKKPPKCEQAAPAERNWEVFDDEYVYWDYVLCPPGAESTGLLVKVWLTGRGDGYSVEKWSPARDGADAVIVYHRTKKAFTLYRDLDAIPLKLFKSERRSAVPAETARRPFLMQGTSLIPLENLTPESAERVTKIFESGDVLVRQSERKVALIRETAKIETIFKALKEPLKERQ